MEKTEISGKEKTGIIKTIINGFCMALADSVPGVSGGTIAFLMGFYDNFVGALDDLISGTKEKRKAAVFYLIKLGIGWAIGFGLAVFILTATFEKHIYRVSSLFIGFILAAIPIVIHEEKDCLKNKLPMCFMVLIGITIVALITYFNPTGGTTESIDFADLKLGMYLYIFLAGAVAICAMILPGISGSTLLLIFGLYMPVISSIKEILQFNFQKLPPVIAFVLGIVVGVISIIKLIRRALVKHRAATVFLIIGLMLGSFYAIVMGPTTLDVPQKQMTVSTFSPLFFIIGAAIIIAMQASKVYFERKNKTE